MNHERLKKILVVDDEQAFRIMLFDALNRAGYDVAVAENGQMALGMVERNPPDLVVTDIRMPEMDGLRLMERVRAIQPRLPVVVVTGFATVDSAVEAMKKGAFDYILKPFPEEVIVETAARALLAGRDAMAGEAEGDPASGLSARLSGRSGSREGKRLMLGNDPLWQRAVDKARAVASSRATVLILGESGTGKEVLARFIHQESDRRDGPFVALNCAALPDGLLESELFGYEKGAFTGAVTAKKGRFELAQGGTLLLDEIGEVPFHLQAKLLRVLQEEEVDRLGGKAPIRFDAHVIATTNRDLAEAVRQGTFRQDLFYRLNVIPIRLPALRDRKNDILPLVEAFAERFSRQYGKKLKRISAVARRRFQEHDWPGNVREMENLVERAVLLCAGNELEPWDFWDSEESPPAVSGRPSGDGSETGAVPAGLPQAPDGPMLPLREVERQMILQALQKSDNNRTHAARMLGISVRTLRNKLQEYREQGIVVG